MRLVSSLALAGALAIGSTGCALVAPIATTKQYAPSDGVQVDVSPVMVRNILLVADAEGDPYNVVFTTVNTSGKTQKLNISFKGKDGSDQIEVTVPKGTTAFGDPKGDQELYTVDLGDQPIGSTVEAAFEVVGAGAQAHKVPVLDGTLKEYRKLTVTKEDVEKRKAKDETANGTPSEQAPTEEAPASR